MSGIPDVLARIVEGRRARLSGETAVGLASRLDVVRPEENRFLAALAAKRGRAVIAEVKMGSPRIGSLAGRVDPVAQARVYAAGGAAALSVVVEPDFFGGSYDLLSRCREASGLPALAKDFVVDPVQLVRAREAGAEAVLLIAALQSADELRRLAGLARGLGLAPLVETHDAADLAKLADAGWELVGINNRDLRSFEVDLERSKALVGELPSGALRVAESGIGGAADIASLRAAGFDAFLVGEALLLSAEPAAKLAELHGRGGAPVSRPLVKVCGVTRAEDARLAVELGADLVGLNFHPASPRCLGIERAREIAAAVAGSGALRVGVFVALAADEIEEVAAAVGLDLVQLHGPEAPEVARHFGARAIQVFRRATPPAAAELARYGAVWGFLFDAPAPPAAGRDRSAEPARAEAYGGTGRTWDHGVLRGVATTRPVLVAGGIRPGNARRALELSGARGVDVCSGIESAPGVKDPDLMRKLFEEIRHGQGRTAS